MRIVDRDGNPIEASKELAGEVREYPEPDDPPEKIVHRGWRSNSKNRTYHRADPDQPKKPACKAKNWSDGSWSRRSSHGIVGNYPACPECFPEVEE